MIFHHLHYQTMAPLMNFLFLNYSTKEDINYPNGFKCWLPPSPNQICSCITGTRWMLFRGSIHGLINNCFNKIIYRKKRKTTKNNSFSDMVKLTQINSGYCEEPTRQSLDGSYPYEDPRSLAPRKKKTTRNKSFWNTMKMTLINSDYCKDPDTPIINMIIWMDLTPLVV